MLRSFTIENFKSFEKATLPLAPLTLLIGANASGKSNTIEALQLLSWLAWGRSPEDLFYAVREQELSLRGGLKDLTRGRGEVLLGCEVIEEPRLPPLTLSVCLEVTEQGLRVKNERLMDGPHVLSDRPPRDSLEAQLEGVEKPHSNGPKYLHVKMTLASMFFLDPDPRRMREYSFVQEKQLKRDGSALSSVLRHLTAERDEKEKVLQMIRALPEQDISDITYLETPRGEVMVQLHETFGRQTMPREAAVLSDGTLRALAVAAALLSVDEGSLVVIEEIDNGVHPSRAEMLLSNIQEIARDRQLCVLLTTHNPALLDAVPSDAVPDIVACYRDPEKGDSRLVRLEDLESYPELVAQGPVGRLVTKGILDRFLKDRDKRDPDIKTEKGLAWVSDFRRRA
jgi:predicted ATPase